MTQVDILLGGLPKEYDIIVNNTKSFDVICKDKHGDYDVYIYDLTDRQGIYGDELDPLIFRLTESEAECLIDINMLIDEDYSNLSLKGSNLNINKQIYTSLKENITRLKTIADVSLVKSAELEENVFRLLTSAGVTNIASVKPQSLSARLTNQITSNMSKVVEILLNASGVHWFDGYLYEYDDRLLSEMDLTYPKMSLVTSCGKIYTKFSFSLEKNTICINSDIPDFTAYTNIKDVIRNDLHLKTDVDFEYQIVCSCNPLLFSLEESDNIPMSVITYISPIGVISELSDWIVESVHTESAIDVVSASRLSIAITDEMEAYYGLGRYDNRYLYQWDDYTIYDMGAEIVNRSQSGSVDM